MERIHYIYIDTNIYRKLTQKNGVQYWNAFYESMIASVPELDEGLYRLVFTFFSFLEAIGEGKIRTKHNYILNLNDFILKEYEFEKDYVYLNNIIDKATQFTLEHFRKHPEISKEKLLKKIESQLDYSSNIAAFELIQNTLVRYKKNINENYDESLKKLILELTWDAICSFDFLKLNKLTRDNNEIKRSVFKKFKESLLNVFHDAQSKGRNLSSYRLFEAIQKELLTSDEFIKKTESENDNKKYKITISGMLKNEHDMCDVDVIHYATLGYYDSEFEKTFPVIIFTSDDRKTIKKRVLLQLAILKFMCKDLISSKLKITPGQIHFIDKNTGIINDDPIIISEINESEGIEIQLDELPPNSKSFVELLTATPLIDSKNYKENFIKINIPESLEELNKLLDSKKNDYIFYGNESNNFELESTLAQELKGKTTYLPRTYIPAQSLCTWKLEEIHKYHWIILNNFIPSKDVIAPLNGKGCPYFQIMKYVQTHPKQEKIRNPIPNHPTQLIPFSHNVNVALDTSSSKLDNDGSIYCIRKSTIATMFSFKECLDEMIKNKNRFPVIIEPLIMLNDVDDLKKQELVCIFQRDLQQPINKYVPTEKIIIKVELKTAIRQYLEEEFI